MMLVMTLPPDPPGRVLVNRDRDGELEARARLQIAVAGDAVHRSQGRDVGLWRGGPQACAVAGDAL